MIIPFGKEDASRKEETQAWRTKEGSGCYQDVGKSKQFTKYYTADVNPCLLWETAKHVMSKRKASSEAS